MNVYILLDRSGSMQTQWAEAIGSINGYVSKIPIQANVMLATFDNISYDVIRSATAGNWKAVSSEEVPPRGGTPLYDSSVRMMWRALDDNSERTIFVCMTDGDENQSRHFKQFDVKALSKQFEDKKWEVIMLGANFDKVSDVAVNYGLASPKFMNISTHNLMRTMTSSVSGASAEYLTRGVPMNYTEADKLAAVQK